MKIFISHINEEQAIAIVLKNWIESTFLGQYQVFVSGSPDDIPAGSKWLDKIDSALNESSIYIVLCSPESVKRNWINFEIGCAWIKKVPVIPLCHSGLSKGSLPIPLSFFQALNLGAQELPVEIFNVLAKHLSIDKLPRIASSEMIHEIKIAVNSIYRKNSISSALVKKQKNTIPINPLGGKTIVVSSNVKDDFHSINKALEKSSNKDQIYVRSGIYEEGYIRLNGKRIYRIIGEERESVIIFGTFSIDCYEAEISNLSVIADTRDSVCGNIMSGKNKIHNCKLSRGRDGLMIQRSGDLKGQESESIITECHFVDNLRGIWIGISGRAVLRANIFENNLIGLLNAVKLKQNANEIADTNEFLDNLRADYVTGWDYYEGTMSNFYNWDRKNKTFHKVEIPKHLKKIKY